MHTNLCNTTSTWKHFVATVSVLLRYNPHQRKSLMHLCCQAQYLGRYTTDTIEDNTGNAAHTGLSQIYRTIDYGSCDVYRHRMDVVRWICNILIYSIGNNVCISVIRDAIVIWDHVSSEGEWETAQLSSLAGACLFISSLIHFHHPIANIQRLTELCGSSVDSFHYSFKRILEYIADNGFPTATVDKMQDAYQQLQHIIDPQNTLDEPWIPTLVEQIQIQTYSHPYTTLEQAVRQKNVDADTRDNKITG